MTTYAKQKQNGSIIGPLILTAIGLVALIRPKGDDTPPDAVESFAFFERSSSAKTTGDENPDGVLLLPDGTRHDSVRALSAFTIENDGETRPELTVITTVDLDGVPASSEFRWNVLAPAPGGAMFPSSSRLLTASNFQGLTGAISLTKTLVRRDTGEIFGFYSTPVLVELVEPGDSGNGGNGGDLVSFEFTPTSWDLRVIQGDTDPDGVFERNDGVRADRFRMDGSFTLKNTGDLSPKLAVYKNVLLDGVNITTQKHAINTPSPGNEIDLGLPMTINENMFDDDDEGDITFAYGLALDATTEFLTVESSPVVAFKHEAEEAAPTPRYKVGDVVQYIGNDAPDCLFENMVVEDKHGPTDGEFSYDLSAIVLGGSSACNLDGVPEGDLIEGDAGVSAATYKIGDRIETIKDDDCFNHRNLGTVTDRIYNLEKFPPGWEYDLDLDNGFKLLRADQRCLIRAPEQAAPRTTARRVIKGLRARRR